MIIVTTTQLRRRFASRLSALYATEVPAYQRLVQACEDINADVLRERGTAAETLGGIDRVTAERHGAIRVGTPREIAQLAGVLAAFGMHPVGFYDLRDASPTPIPVVSTAFRPTSAQELEANPFRLFVSVLVPEDRRFFDAALTADIADFMKRRALFPPRLLDLAAEAESEGRLSAADAEELVGLAVSSLTLGTDPVDRTWYERLAKVSPVAADIAGVPSTHINHLTPRVLDIDRLHADMTAQGLKMLDRIEGPPAWKGPDFLLRQTSFRALDERRQMREPDGSVVEAALRVRFGEVEARGVALTDVGRRVYDRITAEAAGGQSLSVADRIADEFPASDEGMARSALGHYTFAAARLAAGGAPSSLTELLDGGWLEPSPIVYEDFLPKSAAGIFRSNLDSDSGAARPEEGVLRDAAWLEETLGRRLHDPDTLCLARTAGSLDEAAGRLGLAAIDDDRPTTGSATAPAAALR